MLYGIEKEKLAAQHRGGSGKKLTVADLQNKHGAKVKYHRQPKTELSFLNISISKIFN